MLGVGLGAAALLGAALCPTDPVLASSVVTGGPAEEDLPARNRQILSLESGANDGLALPLVLAAMALAGSLTGGSAALESIWQVAGAVMVGAATGWLGGRALKAGEEYGSTNPGPLALFTAVLALTVLGLLLRRLPVLLVLRRPLRLGWVDAVHLGWFGPIGVSAMFYLALEAERVGADPVVLAAGSLVVVASTVAHGVTAAPGRVLYRRTAQRT